MYAQHNEKFNLVKIETKPNDTFIVKMCMPISNNNGRQANEVYEQIEIAIEVNKEEENVIITKH